MRWYEALLVGFASAIVFSAGAYLLLAEMIWTPSPFLLCLLIPSAIMGSTGALLARHTGPGPVIGIFAGSIAAFATASVVAIALLFLLGLLAMGF
jgi:hypothetical protein